MAPTFMTRYISDSERAASPSGRRGRTFKHGTSFYNKIHVLLCGIQAKAVRWNIY
jgi:hypothetical protein